MVVLIGSRIAPGLGEMTVLRSASDRLRGNRRTALSGRFWPLGDSRGSSLARMGQMFGPRGGRLTIRTSE
jgi:hypothetical protein